MSVSPHLPVSSSRLCVLLLACAASCATPTAATSPSAGSVAVSAAASKGPASGPDAPSDAVAGTAEVTVASEPGALASLVPLEPPVVRFVTDSDRLEQDARESLNAFADRWHARKDGPSLLVEGHADERGTEEYNLVLGERRAAAVKRYLSALGVPEDKLRTLSYGELRPATRGDGEEGWAVNRRAELRTNE